MDTCTDCGSSLGTDAIFCVTCGTAVASKALAGITPAPIIEVSTPSQTRWYVTYATGQREVRSSKATFIA